MKKRQFALIFMTVVLMLAIWYIKTPLKQNKTTETTVVSSKIDVVKTMRDEVINQRSAETASLDYIIASADTTILQKEKALAQKKSISDLTEKEISLESVIVSLGYVDAFVFANTSFDIVEVTIVSPDESIDVALEVINLATLSFEDFSDVTVSFVKMDELAS